MSFKFLLNIILCSAAFTFSANLRVNQAGYLPSLPKFIYSTAASDSFYVCDAASGIIYYRGAFQFLTANDPATGFALYRGDFSSFTREGLYKIISGSQDTSFQFRIHSVVLDEVFRKSLKGFYFQRCGISLNALNAGSYNRLPCHLNDGTFHSTTGQSGYHQSTRGWHDAGDYGKYIVNAGITAGTLLMAYESFPGKFGFDNLNIPESGNGIPDLLDEVKFEIDWFLTMQAPSGGVYFKLTPEQFEPFVMPAQATAQRFIYTVSSTAAGDFIAVLARFARIYKQYDSVYAIQCLVAAENAWDYLSSQLSIVPPGGFHNPPGTATGEYGDGNDLDERLWAAAELFETTGESEYKDYFDFNFDQQGVLNSTMWWGNVRSLAQLTYLNSLRASADVSVKNSIRNSLNSYCTQLLNKRNNNGFGITLNPGEYTWGSNSSALNNAVILIYGYEESGNINFFNAALDQMNYVLGINGTGYSFVTGIGQKRTMYPHHRPSQSDGINEPVPGLLAGGPDQYLSDPVLQQLYNSSTPPALCYVDNWGSYASNEIAINWNAPLVFVSGYFNQSSLTSIKDETGELNPGGFNLYQNYPNPFNPRTTILYSIPETSHVIIKLFDISGSEVRVLVDDKKTAGEHEVELDASSLPGGLYFYRMISENFVSTKKIVFLK